MNRVVPVFLLSLLGTAPLFCSPTSLVPGDPLTCFNRMEGPGTLTTVPVTGMPFTTALHVKTGAVAPTANSWDIRPRCFNTLPAAQNDIVVATFWMRTINAPNGLGLTTFVVEQGISPYTKSVTYTAAAQSAWKKVEAPFAMAQPYAAGGYNLSFWVTFPNQEIEIGGFTILDYGLGVPFSQLGLTTWPYEGHEADAPWRTSAAQRIERYRKGDVVVVVRDDAGNPIPNAAVHVKMKRHAFGFGTAVAGDVIQRNDSTGQNYRDAIVRLFNKVVVENALKWPVFEGNGRAQSNYMLPWFASNGIKMVRGHNVIWPGLDNLPTDVQNMLKATPVNQTALRSRINAHFEDVMGYARGKVTEWDVINEPVTNKDVMAALGDAEMVAWFQKARVLDPSVKLYLNDYSNVESGGYDLQHINGTYTIIQNILAAGGPIDGIGLQAHFDTNLTPPDRVYEVLDKFASFGKELQVTEFDVGVPDEQIQADYTRDFMTLCFSHPAMQGFMIWGFWEGAHWRPSSAMFRLNWTTKPNYDVWNDLIFHQWWTDVTGTTGPDGIFRTRGFLGDYDVDITASGTTRTVPLTLASNTQPAYTSVGNPTAVTITAAGVVNGASFAGGTVAPGEIVTIFGTGFGPSTLALAGYDANGQLPTAVGDTRVLFNGAAAPMIHSKTGQTSAVAPYSISGSTQMQVEYLGVQSTPVAVPVAAAAPGIFMCGDNKTPVMVNDSAFGKISCNSDWVPLAPGSIVTFFMTGEGALSPAIPDGKLPPGAPYSAPVAPWKVMFGNVEATPCAATFIGLVYAGVTQVNTCVPDGVPRTTNVPFTVSVAGVSSPATAVVDLTPQWQVIWSDEFNGPAGSSVDPANWNFDLGNNNGWGNAEREVYTNSTDNVYQDGNGNLVIKAIFNGIGYTSGRIKTQNLFNPQYGKIEGRIKIPYGQGIWPAFWMLGNDLTTVGWPTCGEIDIMENIGKEPSIVHGTLHGPGYSGGNGIGGPYSLPGGQHFSDDFHLYGIEWSANSIAFFVDGNKYFEATPAQMPSGRTWVFQHPFFIIMNLAVGGSWPGYPDSTTVFPQTMTVDWVRVSQAK